MTSMRWLAIVALLSSILGGTVIAQSWAAPVAPSDWLFSGIDTAHPTSNQLTLSAGERPAIALLRIVDADGHAHLFAPHAVAARHRLSLTLPVLASLHLTPPLSLEVRALAPLGAVLRQQASGHSWLVSSTAVHIASAGTIYLAAQSVAGSPPRLALLSSAPTSTRVVLTARNGGRTAAIAFHLPAGNARWVPVSLFGLRGSLLVSVRAARSPLQATVRLDTCACRTQSAVGALVLLAPLRPHREPRIAAPTATPLATASLPPDTPSGTPTASATAIPPISSGTPTASPIPATASATAIPPISSGTPTATPRPVVGPPVSTALPTATVSPTPTTPSPGGIPNPPSPPSPP